jgi:hypothetical protein
MILNKGDFRKLECLMLVDSMHFGMNIIMNITKGIAAK